MERIKSLESAYELVYKCRLECQSNEGAWQFLYRVAKYIQKQSREAFAQEFGA